MRKFEIITIEELIERLDKHYYKQLHIHHTWKPRHSNFNGNNHIQLQEGMYNHHVNVRKWADVGQHVTLMPDGLFVTGRDFWKAPASIKYWNKDAFAIEVLGNFDIGYDKLEGIQRLNLLKLARYFGIKYGFDSIKFHRDGPGVKKTCPGSSVDKNKFISEAKYMAKDKIFNDVLEGRWSYEKIKKAKELGLINGDGQGNFSPENPLTREQAAVLMVRLYELLKEDK